MTISYVPSAVSGFEDSSLIVLQLAATTGFGTATTGFRVTGLPTNGKLFLDQAKTTPVLLDRLLASTSDFLTLYFEPAGNFNGNVDLKYVAVGTHSDVGGRWSTGLLSDG